MRQDKVLAIDVGGGTQDIFLYKPGQPVENCIKLVLPSQTVVVGRQIRRATAAGKAVFLTGNLMGGGACVGAVKAHLQEGLAVYAAPEAAKTIHDDLEQVKALGVVITGEAPKEAIPIRMGDINLEALRQALAAFEVELPSAYAVAVQDHGEAIGESNRAFRFRHLRRMMEAGGELTRLVYREVPPYLTRMGAVQKELPGAVMMDTGGAAIWGALADPEVARHREDGLVVVNIGNNHTLGVLVQGERIWGLFEHHTRLMTPAKLQDYIARLRTGQLSYQEVFADGGHGCYIHSEGPASGSYEFVSVTGPHRSLAQGLGCYMAVPHGDMMLAGCFGLVAALQATQREEG